jgi:hexulose-6-phosphate isomerase
MRWNVTDRRHFLKQAAVAGALSLSSLPCSAAEPAKPKLKLAVKYGMVKGTASIEEKFALLKRIGFAGVELDSPSGINRDEVVAARDKTGIVIHGVVDSIHWKDTLSNPDAEVRARGMAGLKTAIADCKTYGGDTVLLVPGVVNKDATFEQCWERSVAEIKTAIPIAKAAGVKIAIEVVWNNFITKPEQLVKYVDEFKDPTIGAYFDCSNMLKYEVPAAEWIRQLGKRMFKFDFKGYNIPDKKWVAIGEGSEDWPEVRKALVEVGYEGWATSEVGAGDETYLRDIYDRMYKALLA